LFQICKQATQRYTQSSLQKETSSLSIEDKKFIMTPCFLGNLMHKDLERKGELQVNSDKLAHLNIILMNDYSQMFVKDLKLLNVM